MLASVSRGRLRSIDFTTFFRKYAIYRKTNSLSHHAIASLPKLYTRASPIVCPTVNEEWISWIFKKFCHRIWSQSIGWGERKDKKTELKRSAPQSAPSATYGFSWTLSMWSIQQKKVTEVEA
jgi:hypothetical protein